MAASFCACAPNKKSFFTFFPSVSKRGVRSIPLSSPPRKSKTGFSENVCSAACVEAGVVDFESLINVVPETVLMVSNLCGRVLACIGCVIFLFNFSEISCAAREMMILFSKNVFVGNNLKIFDACRITVLCSVKQSGGKNRGVEKN